MDSATRALAFKSESVFSIVNKSWQRFFSLSFVLRCYNNFHQRQNATNISVFLSHGETLHYENKLVYLKDSNAASHFVNSLILFALSRTA